MYTISQVSPADRRAQAQIDGLLEQEGIRRDANLDYVCAMYDGDGCVIATGSCFGNTLRCFAVSREHQGEGLLNQLVAHLMQVQLQRGNLHLFVYTKTESARFFQDLGFHCIAQTPGRVSFLENRRAGFPNFLQGLVRECGGPTRSGAAVVMNANPFTLGHRYLVEQAAAQCDLLHLFVVTEDASLVPFSARYRLVKEGTADLPNVVLHQTGSYMISSSTFPSYFIKDAGDVIRAQARLDIQVFKRIAAALGVSARFVGEEPFSQVTSIYNGIMKEELEKDGLCCNIIPRKEEDGRAISASAVRQLIHDGKLEEVRPLVPESTYRFFLTPQGEKVAAAIRAAGEVIHY